MMSTEERSDSERSDTPLQVCLSLTFGEDAFKPHSDGGRDHHNVTFRNNVILPSSLDLKVLKNLPHKQHKRRVQPQSLPHAIMQERHVVDVVERQVPVASYDGVLLLKNALHYGGVVGDEEGRPGARDAACVLACEEESDKEARNLPVRTRCPRPS